jgi:hypothetical protein
MALRRDGFNMHLLLFGGNSYMSWLWRKALSTQRRSPVCQEIALRDMRMLQM